MSQTILVVDDKKSVQQLLSEFLLDRGYQVNLAANGNEAFESISKETPDLILLDIMMPEMDGYEFIRRLRQSSDTPVIMISAKQHESDLIKGFNLGADDYIIKPFRLSELLVRLKAVLRRSAKYDSITTCIKFSGLELNKLSNEASFKGAPLALTASEFCLLTLLVQCAEQAVNKADLCRYLIEHGNTGLESTLKIHIRNLRMKLIQNDLHDFEISSVFGIGYRLSVITS